MAHLLLTSKRINIHTFIVKEHKELCKYSIKSSFLHMYVTILQLLNLNILSVTTIKRLHISVLDLKNTKMKQILIYCYIECKLLISAKLLFLRFYIIKAGGKMPLYL